MFRELGDPQGIANNLGGLGLVALSPRISDVDWAHASRCTPCPIPSLPWRALVLCEPECHCRCRSAQARRSSRTRKKAGSSAAFATGGLRPGRTSERSRCRHPQQRPLATAAKPPGPLGLQAVVDPHHRVLWRYIEGTGAVFRRYIEGTGAVFALILRVQAQFWRKLRRLDGPTRLY